MAHSNFIIVIFSLLFSLIFPKNFSGDLFFNPGSIWKDTKGNTINAHSGGILFHNGTYYWYGEIKKGESKLIKNTTDFYRCDAGGVSCYSSKNLKDWNYLGVALEPNTTDSLNDLHISKVIERPKVIYNEKTKKFVMWLHVDSEDYSYARAGVAVSDSPQGPFEYLGSLRPNGQMSRDQTLFKDDNGKAYQICSSEHNRTMYVNELTDDYLNTTGVYNRNFIDLSREAPAIVKHNKKYYILSSGCTGWDPNQAQYASSDSIMGKFSLIGSPCSGPNADITFYAQSTFIFPVQGKKDTYIAMFDQWNRSDLQDSRYVWLPLKFVDGKMVIEWKEKWQIR